MLAELRTKSQITIPKEIVKKLGLEEGDKLEIFEKDGMICLMPVKDSLEYVSALRREIDRIKANIDRIKADIDFGSIDSLFDKSEED